jgi:hypothetical protein
MSLHSAPLRWRCNVGHILSAFESKQKSEGFSKGSWSADSAEVNRSHVADARGTKDADKMQNRPVWTSETSTTSSKTLIFHVEFIYETEGKNVTI